MYNKLSVALATIAAIAITVVLVVVHHVEPFSLNLKVAFGVLLFSEALLGGLLVHHMGLSEAEFPYAIGENVVNICYFFFAVGMLFATHVQLKYFVAWQIVALLVLLILHIVFRIAGHGIKIQSKREDVEEPIQKASVTWR